MTEKAVLEGFDCRRLFTETPPPANRPVFVHCPAHKDNGRPNLAVYPHNAHCFACGFHEGAAWVVAWQNGLDVKADYLEVLELAEQYAQSYPPLRVAAEQTAELPPISLDLVKAYHRTLIETAKDDYFLKRGLRMQTVIGERLGYSGSAYVIPVWTEDYGAVQTLRFRRDDECGTDRSKYWGIKGYNVPMVYNLPALRGEVGRVVLCEGELDALCLSQYGEAAISFTNGCNVVREREAALLRAALPAGVPVVIAWDQDKASYWPAVEAAQLIGGARVARWSPSDGKDVTEVIKRKGYAHLRQFLDKALSVRSRDECSGQTTSTASAVARSAG